MSQTQRAIFDRIYTKVEELDITAWRTSEPVAFAEKTRGRKLALKIGESWGNSSNAPGLTSRVAYPRTSLVSRLSCSWM